MVCDMRLFTVSHNTSRVGLSQPSLFLAEITVLYCDADDVDDGTSGVRSHTRGREHPYGAVNQTPRSTSYTNLNA